MSYDRLQQVVSLSFLTNVGNTLKGKNTPEYIQSQTTAITHKVLDAGRSLVGNWNIVWGPVVYTVLKKTKTRAANTMMVTRKDNIFLITVAGTNGSSSYDWFVEDFTVGIVKAWDKRDPTKGHIALGTHVALKHLLGMKDPITHQSLFEFLSQVHFGSGFEVIVSGHSLGGTLTPPLALLLDNKRAEWGGNGVQIFAYPTAGATPGDEQWASYFRSVFPGDRYHAVKNSLDVIPHAWDIATLANLANIYLPYGLPPGPTVSAIVNLAILSSKSHHYKQIAGQEEFQGTFKPPTGHTLFEKFFFELLQQHVQAYYYHFGILDWMNLIKENMTPKQLAAENPDLVGHYLRKIAFQPEVVQAMAQEQTQ